MCETHLAYETVMPPLVFCVVGTLCLCSLLTWFLLLVCLVVGVVLFGVVVIFVLFLLFGGVVVVFIVASLLV